MMQQLYLDTIYSDATLADGTHVFALRDPITVPERHTLHVRLLNAWLPLSYYSIFEENDTLVLGYYDDGSDEWAPDVTVRLPRGNRSMDDLVAFLNAGRLHDYVARYDEFTNRVTLEGTDEAEAVLVMQPGTTCQRLLARRRHGQPVGRLPLPVDCQ
jgi:hypothetical protein